MSLPLCPAHALAVVISKVRGRSTRSVAGTPGIRILLVFVGVGRYVVMKTEASEHMVREGEARVRKH